MIEIRCLTVGVFVLLSVALGAMAEVQKSEVSGRSADCTNPVLPGYYADPSLVQYDGKSYIYATLDPWGGETLGCWESADFRNWTYRELNWPTKAACTSSTSRGAMVWAPSVIQGVDGKFYMYVSVGSEVWAGVAEHPLGPWKNLLGDRPLIPEDYKPGFHMIDAEAFIDDDGQAYLYWGSGWNWTNGKCWAVKLAPDMNTFVGAVHDVTPPNFFEAPIMVKRHGRYFLMYSDGKTTIDTYQVHYAVGDSPFGPFTEAENSPVLKTDHALNVLSPGHHTILSHQGQDYILYHRHSIPFDRKFVGRQICIDPLEFLPGGTIKTLKPGHDAPEWAQGRMESDRTLTAIATASGWQENAGPASVLDNNYATRWAASQADAWLQIDLGEEKTVSRQLIRPEYAWKRYAFKVEFSVDGEQWEVLKDWTNDPVSGSPIVIEQSARGRYFRLVFVSDEDVSEPSVFEWNLR